MTVTPTWQEVFRAHFYTISPHERDVWEELIIERFPDWKEGEICAAVKSLAERVRSGDLKLGRRKVGCNDIISAVIANRYEERVSGRTYMRQTHREALINETKHKIRTALATGDSRAVWNLICDANAEGQKPEVSGLPWLTLGESMELMAFTQEVEPKFEPPERIRTDALVKALDEGMKEWKGRRREITKRKPIPKPEGV